MQSDNVNLLANCTAIFRWVSEIASSQQQLYSERWCRETCIKAHEHPPLNFAPPSYADLWHTATCTQTQVSNDKTSNCC